MESGIDLFAMAAALTAEEDSRKCGTFAVDRQMSVLEKIRARVSSLASSVHLPVVQASEASVEEFEQRFHVKSQPAVLLGCLSDTHLSQLSLDHLHLRFGSESFALYNGQAFTLDEYISYCNGRAETDLLPLYVFEDLSLVAPSEVKSAILNYYSVPEFFRSDMFELVQESMPKVGRPRFRWLLVGPTRSGTPLHRDPHGTSAWNSLVSGSKHWVLLPPNTKESVLRLDIKDHLVWCDEVLPGLLQDESVGVIEYLQRPGETVFVPAGWWHAVVNLELSVAVTENLAVACNAKEVLRSFIEKEVWSSESRLFYAALVQVLHTEEVPGVCVDFVPKTFQCSEDGFKWNLWGSDDRLWLYELKRRYQRNYARICRASKGQGAGRIPKRLHQIWLGPRPVPFQDDFIQTWKDLHSRKDGWEYKLWRDADAEEEYSKSTWLRAAMEAASNFGEQSDILRYYILHKYGGLYVDVDFECLQPFNLITHGSFSFVCGFSNVNAVEINNGFIAAIPSHPLLSRLMRNLKPCLRKDGVAGLVASFLGSEDEVMNHAIANVNWMNTIERTGPGLFTRTVMSYIVEDDGDDDVLVLPSICLYPAPNCAKEGLRRFATEQTLAIHHWKKTWQRKD